MDPAELDQIKRALATQATRVHQNETLLTRMAEHVQQTNANVSQLGGRMAALSDQLAPSPGATGHPPADQRTPVSASQAREPYIPIPARYSGDLGTCAQFLHQCQLVFSQQPHTCATPQAKTAVVMSLLTGQAAAWSLAISTQQPQLKDDYLQFIAEMK